jgi:sodium/bile acid cotransporter 7
MPARKGWRPDAFLVGLVAAAALAFVYPDAGAAGGWLRPGLLNRVGVALIFFLHGAALPFSALKAGTQQGRIHALVQGCTFLLFPLLGLGALALLEGRGPPGLAIGVYFLCALPSTVSSSVALTAAARGNVPAALFNATASNLLGVVLTPLWLGLVLGPRGQLTGVGGVVRDLVLSLVLPLAAGQVARRFIGGFVARHRRAVTAVDRGTILLLVHTSFADSVAQGVWTGRGATAVVLAGAISVVLLALVLGATWAASAAAGLPLADRIAVVFCGSKKTLAAGVPMAQVIFRGDPTLGLVLLPLLVFHPLQLVVCGYLAGRWGARPEAALPSAPPV